MRATIETQLASKLDATLVKALLDAHAEAKRDFYLGGLRLSAVEGGRFCEAAFRLLQDITEHRYTPLNKTLPKTDDLIFRLSQLDSSKFNDAVRLHIPRSLRLVYDIRNKRDTAHLSDGIDPNLQDATLVVTVIDWVLAEFIRLYHASSKYGVKNCRWYRQACRANRSGLQRFFESAESEVRRQRPLLECCFISAARTGNIRRTGEVGTTSHAAKPATCTGYVS